ncbi:MAG: phosphotransferase [Proteobacteria bacterium]|nr:phosphotransferase [Pseudomonadota bacterium]
MIPIVHSVVDAAALGEHIRRRWKLPLPLHCELITRGMNDVYLVRTAVQQYAARVWRADKSSEMKVLFELEYLRHLAAGGVPVVAPLPDSDGALFFSVEVPEGSRPVCLFEWAEGVPFSKVPSPDVARRIGAVVAQLHTVSQSFEPPVGRPIDFPGSIRRNYPALAQRLVGRPGDLAFYSRAGEAIAEALEQAYSGGIPFGPIHGDVHVHNVFVTKEGELTILDFDTCGEAHLAHDLMSFVWANEYISINVDGLGPDISEAFLAGYEEVRPLSERERAFLPLAKAAKEFSYMCGMSAGVNVVGHMSMGPDKFDWFARSVRKHVAAAGLKVGLEATQ